MKADTMNIELPPLPESTWHPAPHERAFCPGEVEAFARAAVLADRASRSRAASEPGEVARLADEAISKMIDFAEDVWQAGKDGFRCDSIAPCRERRAAAESAIRRLASATTSPASEAQAGWVMVPREPTLEMGWAYLEAARKSSPLIEHVFNHPGYRAMLASAPQPASSPVAAEGQKVVTEYVPVLEYSAEEIVAEHTKGFQTGFESGREYERKQLATPTASMADAAEAVDEPSRFLALIDIGLTECREAFKDCKRKLDASPMPDHEWMLWQFAWLQSRSTTPSEAQAPAPTPSPRGENAGGVVEAWQPIETAPKDGTELLLWRDDCGQFIGSYTTADSFPLEQKEIDTLSEEELFTHDWFTQWPDARRLEGSELPTHWQHLPPDRGLRIAEKGDAP